MATFQVLLYNIMSVVSLYSKSNLISLPILHSLGGVPSDGVRVVHNITEKIHEGVTVTYFILVSAGIAFAMFCLIFNFIFRDRK